MSKVIELWTDGAIHKNGRPEAIGGWACILRFVDIDFASREVTVLKEKEMSGSQRAAGTTSNEMELRGVLEGLRAISPNFAGKIAVKVFSDSEYVTKGFSGRSDKWAHYGWKPRPNVGMLKEIHELANTFGASFTWIKGHAGMKYNERADELAVAAKEEEMKKYYEA
ncbi:ribonuclease HI [Paenibacillus xylanexedens]|uniref:ribonuclease HI n=1 Tax=Paenibacillus xylanexedens TaxID=528191 RepID=UPI0011A4412A|nr:ribonuclease H [Paenibacillus xylanexedens]